MITMKLFIFVLFLVHCLVSISAVFFPYAYPRIMLGERSAKDAGEPLILTPFLRNGTTELARILSRVTLTETFGFESHAGFFTVNEHFNSNMYFWYFPPISKNKNAPVILWLQGGPGASSLFGLFTELGPLTVTKAGFALREYHWALDNHLIFIDNPVGAGFSFTNDGGYCSDEQCVGTNLYEAMQQFFTLFPDLRCKDFYITGESYAGKYVPALAMQIHSQNMLENADVINLKGLAMGNAYCDPIHQMDYGDYLYQHGLLDFNQRDLFEKIQNKISQLIQRKDWTKADTLMDKLMDGDLGNFSYFKSYTGFDYYYNFLQTTDDTDMTIFAKLLSNDDVRQSVHVGGLPFNDPMQVQLHMVKDILKSVAPLISELLSHYRVLFYNGQLDIIVAYPLTESFLRNLPFSSAVDYKSAPRHIWRVNEQVAGYYKKAGNLTEVLVRNAGHMVPHDQPVWALDMLTKFLRNKF